MHLGFPQFIPLLCNATRYYFGDNDWPLGKYAWFNGNSGTKTHLVGQKKPNAWALYDMSGNVWEWCEDTWHDSYAEKNDNIKNNGNAAWFNSNESGHILRGGSWINDSRGCRSVIRDWADPDSMNDNIGFRLVLLPPVGT